MPVVLSDNVPGEECLTGNYDLLSIEQGVKILIDSVLQLKEVKSKAFDIEFEDYNIENIVEKLEEYYFRIINESGRV